MLNFITLFDRNYLSQGLILYDSLAKYCDDFVLYILAMDIETENILKKEENRCRRIISLSEIESFYPELKEIKQKRDKAEYCWTLTPYSIQYAIITFNLESCIYIDADIAFFNDPNLLLNNIGDNSVLITEHRYTPKYDRIQTSGKYCVQFMFFKNDSFGLHTLEWWRQKCMEWCYDKFEEGKFGDQKYLDDWTTRFEKIYVSPHIGCGLAPWNIQQYNITSSNGALYVQDKITLESKPLVFFHFHALKNVYADEDKFIWSLCGGYSISESIKELLYNDYVNMLTKYERKLGFSRVSLEKKYIIKKPDVPFLIWRIVKDIIKSLFLVKKYKYYKKIFTEQFNQDKVNLKEVLN